jgi:hypothetical protein
VFVFLHNAYTSVDLASQNYPFDIDHGAESDIPVEILHLDGYRVAPDRSDKMETDERRARFSEHVLRGKP